VRIRHKNRDLCERFFRYQNEERNNNTTKGRKNQAHKPQSTHSNTSSLHCHDATSPSFSHAVNIDDDKTDRQTDRQNKTEDATVTSIFLFFDSFQKRRFEIPALL